MNSFAALMLDSDDEEETPKVVVSKTITKTGKPATAKKAEPVVRKLVPGEVARAPKVQAQPVKVAAAEPVVTDVLEASEIIVTGKNKSNHQRESRDQGKPKPKRNQTHDKDHTGSGAANDSKSGGGSFGRGNVSEEARRAEKGEFVTENGVVEEGSPDEESEPVEPEAATFSLDEYMARRNEARSNFNSEAFGSVKEREVTGAEFKVHARADAAFIPGTNMKAIKVKEAKGPKQQLEVAFKVAPVDAPREERSFDRAGGRGGGRGSGRGGGRGETGRGGRDSGRGGRGAGRSYANNTGSRIDIASQDAFPSL